MTDLTNTNPVFRKGSEEDDRPPRKPSQGFVEAHYRRYSLRILSTYLQFYKFKIKRTLEFLSKLKIMRIKANVTGASIAKIFLRATWSGSKSQENK